MFFDCAVKLVTFLVYHLFNTLFLSYHPIKMVNLVFLSLQRHIFSAKLELWRWVQPRTDLHLLQEAPLPLHTQCLHQHRPEKTNSPQRKRSLIVN